jgi:hypothetical protein
MNTTSVHPTIKNALNFARSTGIDQMICVDKTGEYFFTSIKLCLSKGDRIVGIAYAEPIRVN